MRYNKSNISDVLKALKKVKQLKGGQYIAVCPAHKDTKPSLSVKEVDHGKVVVFCHVGCTFLELRQAFNGLGIRI